MSNKLKYYNNLDGVRAIAVLLVMFGHFFMTLHSKYGFVEIILRKISILGQLGVALFFVLSGFLITRILLYSKEKKGYFKNFYIRRILRIFPLYYLFLILYFFLFPFIFNSNIPEFSQQIYYYTYLQNFAVTFNWNAAGPIHFWSLAIEEHFYLFWPFFVYFFKDKQMFIITLFIIVFAIILRYFFIQNNIEVYYFTFTRFDALAIGAVLALLERNIFKQKVSKQFYLILLLIIIVPTSVLWVFYGGKANYLLQILKYMLFSVGFFALIGYIIQLKDKHFLNKVLTIKFLTYTGKISYGLYVYHLFSFHLIQYYFQSEYWIVNFIISFSIAYALSALSYHFFETKFLFLKKYFTTK